MKRSAVYGVLEPELVGGVRRWLVRLDVIKRGLPAAFMTLLLELLRVLVGASVYGIAMLRHGRRTMGVWFACLLPLTVILGVAGQSAFGLPLGGLLVAAAAFGLLNRGSSRT